MSKIEEKLKYKGIMSFLEKHHEVSRQDFKKLGLNDYEIKKLMEEKQIEKIGRGKYQTIKKEPASQEKTVSGFDAVQSAFDQKDVNALYKSFQNLELNEEMIRNLYPLLLSGLITLQKEIESLKKVKITEEKAETAVEVETEMEEETEDEIEVESEIDVKVEDEDEAEIENKTEVKVAEEKIPEVLEEEDQVEEEEISYSYEEAEQMHQAYLESFKNKDYKSARVYLLIYIKQSEKLGICDDRYYRLFGVEKKIYEENYPKDTIDERWELEDQFDQFLKTNQLQKAKECYQRLLMFEKGENPYYDFLLRKLVLVKEGENSAFLRQVVEKLYQNFPTYPPVLHSIALNHFAERNYQQTIKALNNYFKYDLGEHSRGDLLLISCYFNLGEYKKADEVVINAENYLKPEILSSFYQRAIIEKKKHMKWLERNCPPFLIEKNQERYEACKNVFEKEEAIWNMPDMSEELENSDNLSYYGELEDVFAKNHSVVEVNNYINELGLEGCDKMSMKLLAAEFFAKEKYYDASQRSLKEVESYKGKDSLLKEQLASTQKQIKLMKVKNR